MSTPGFVLVTGASGFIGAHTVKQLLEAGYRVRGTARGGKLDELRSAFKDNAKFEAVAINDVAEGDFSDALKDITAVLHIAAPLPGKADAETALRSTVEGTVNIIRQAVKAGIYKVVLTSTWGVTTDPPFKQVFQGVKLNGKSWGKTSREDLLAHADDPVYFYIASKILAEQAAWKVAEEHPELDLAVILPPFVYGPFVPGFTFPEPAFDGSNAVLYSLLSGEPGRPLPPSSYPVWIHVRDVARAEVLALSVPKLPPTADRQDKRFLIVGPGALRFDAAVRHLLVARPQYAARLPNPENNPPADLGPVCTSDVTPAAEVLGLKEYISLERTLEETLDFLVHSEEVHKAKGSLAAKSAMF